MPVLVQVSPVKTSREGSMRPWRFTHPRRRAASALAFSDAAEAALVHFHPDPASRAARAPLRQSARQ